MNDLTIVKIQNTINEIENQLTKADVDTAVYRLLMQRAVIQLNELITHISYLENKTQPNQIDRFDDWIKIGLESNWCGPPLCYTHDAFPLSEEEDNEFAEGGDPCVHMIRLYEDEQHKLDIEDAHSPSLWRKPYESK
jgi:hypothetical protein